VVGVRRAALVAVELVTADKDKTPSSTMGIVGSPTGGNGPGGGNLTVPPLPSNNAFLSAAISCRRGRFSHSRLPSWVRKWSRSRSRSAMSPASVSYHGS